MVRNGLTTSARAETLLLKDRRASLKKGRELAPLQSRLSMS
jgi:hypothetical protein